MLFRKISVAVAGSLLAMGTAAESLDQWVKKRVVPPTHSLHERHHEIVATQWQKRERLPADRVLPMRVGLKQFNIQDGHEKLMDISNPRSPNYGKHMTAEEVIDFFAPEQYRVDQIMEWLSEAGISTDRLSLSTNKQWVQFDALAAEVENILYAELYTWEHSLTGSIDIATSEYHLPTHISEHVDYITPGIRLRGRPNKVAETRRRDQLSAMEKRGISTTNTGLKPLPEHLSMDKMRVSMAESGTPLFNSSVCDEYVTAVCIRNQYRMPKGTKAAPGNELGIFESLNDHVTISDLDLAWEYVYPDIPVGTYPAEELINGAVGYAETAAEMGEESALDFQAAMPLIYPQSTILFQTDDEYYETAGLDKYEGFWNTFYDAIDGSYCTYSAFGETGDCTTPDCNDPSYPDPNGYGGQRMCGVYKPTNVISISYGGAEIALPAYYTERQCNEIMKLGLQGTTVVISSGDYGIGGSGNGGDACLGGGDGRSIFNPQSDATCPYVLSVGSTEFDDYTTPGAPACKLNEVSTTAFASGGGFSNYFPTPDYQVDAVNAYFASVDLGFDGYDNYTGNFSDIPTGIFNRNGRGYPDVSAIGDRFIIVYGGSLYTIGGTSLSAPVWASVITRINEERLAVNKSTVGFINPTLYANPQVLNDITEGQNADPACTTPFGFVAATGWDPVSGLGSPNYPKLVDLFLSLP